MNTVINNIPKPKAGLWWKILLALLLLLFTGLFILSINFNSIAHTQINRALNTFLVAGGTLDNIDLQLATGEIDLSGLTINSPEAFGSKPPLKLNSLHLNLNLSAILNGEIAIDELALKEVAFVLVRNAQGELSVLNLIPHSDTDDIKTTSTDKQEPFSIPAIHINSLLFDKVSLLVIDQLTKKQWTGKLDLNLKIDDLYLKDLMNGDILTGEVSLALSKLNLDQPEGFSQSPLFELTKLDLNIPEIDFNAKRWTVKQLRLGQLSASLESNEARTTNLQLLSSSWFPATATKKQKQKTSSLPLPTLFFENIELKSIALQYLKPIKKQLWRAGFNELDIQLEDLNLELSNIQASSLNALNLNLKSIAVDQPVSTKDDSKILTLDQFSISSNALDFSAPELSIKQVLLSGLHSSISVQPDGVSNIEQLSQALFRSISTTKQAGENKSSETNNKLPSLLIEQAKIENSALNYRNEMITETPLMFPLSNIQVNINQLRLFDKNTQAPPASVTASFQLEQPNELPSAYFGVLANIGTIGIGVPQVNAQIRMTGLKLDTLGTLITPTMRRTVGATGMDVGAALALDAETIKLQASAFSDEGIHYNAIKMQGPLSAPSIEMGAILSGVYSRVSDGIFNFGKGGLSAGGDIALGGVNVVKSVGGGAISIGKNLGKSLFEVGEGLVTWDKGELIKGLDGSSRGTFNLTAGSVANAGSAATGGLKESASELRGAKTVEAWDAEIQVRYDINIKQAKEALSNMPYPPVTH